MKECMGVLKKRKIKIGRYNMWWKLLIFAGILLLIANIFIGWILFPAFDDGKATKMETILFYLFWWVYLLI